LISSNLVIVCTGSSGEAVSSPETSGCAGSADWGST